MPSIWDNRSIQGGRFQGIQYTNERRSRPRGAHRGHFIVKSKTLWSDHWILSRISSRGRNAYSRQQDQLWVKASRELVKENQCVQWVDLASVKKYTGVRPFLWHHSSECMHHCVPFCIPWSERNDWTCYLCKDMAVHQLLYNLHLWRSRAGPLQASTLRDNVWVYLIRWWALSILDKLFWGHVLRDEERFHEFEKIFLWKNLWKNIVKKKIGKKKKKLYHM